MRRARFGAARCGRCETRFVQRLGWAVGNRKALQLVTDAMKVSPINPSFLQGRDAIISVALGSATTTAQLEDAADVWAGFAVRGMGVGASIQNLGTDEVGDTRVTESFDKPNLLQLPNYSISDIAGDNDGLAEPGESLLITIPLTNLVRPDRGDRYRRHSRRQLGGLRVDLQRYDR